MYNAVCGEDKYADELLHMLRLDKDFFERYRDCYLSPDGKYIIVYTRLGGSNRGFHSHVFEEIKAHPLFVEDYDDSFDSTFASFKFIVPLGREDRVNEMLEDADTRTGEQRMKDIFDAMEKDIDALEASNPRVKAFNDNMRKAFENSDGGILMINPDGTVEHRDF